MEIVLCKFFWLLHDFNIYEWLKICKLGQKEKQFANNIILTVDLTPTRHMNHAQGKNNS